MQAGQKSFMRGDQFVKTAIVFGVLALALVDAVCLFGFGSNDIFLTFSRWESSEWLPLLATLAPFAIVLFGATLSSAWWHWIVVGVVIAAGLVAFGPQVLAVFTLQSIAAIAIGLLFLSSDDEKPVEKGLFAFVIGYGVIGTLISDTAQFAVHYDFVYGAIAALIIVLRHRQLLIFSASIAATIGIQARQDPSIGRTYTALSRLPMALTILLGIMLAMYAAPLESGWDPLVVHLRILDSLAYHGSWAYDFVALPFTLMPKLSIWSMAWVHVLGGEMASRALNVVFVFVSVGLVASFLNDFLPRWSTAILLFSFLSAPITLWVCSTLFEEGGATMFITASGMLLLRAWRKEPSQGAVILALAALGFAVAAKAQSLFLGGLGAVIVVRHVARKPDSSGFGAVAAGSFVFLVCAASPYFRALIETGNPFYPFYPFSADNGIDPRWTHPMNWWEPFAVAFNTHFYMESLDGTFAFHLPLLIAAALAGVLATRRADLAAIFGAIALFAVALWSQTHIARYLYYALPLLTLVAGSWFMVRVRWVQVFFAASLLALSMANIAAWRGIPIPPFNLGHLLNRKFATDIPEERRGFEALNAIYGQQTNVYVGGARPFGAGLAGRAQVLSPIANQLSVAKDAATVTGLLDRDAITHLLFFGPAKNPLVERVAAAFGRAVIVNIFGLRLYSWRNNEPHTDLDEVFFFDRFSAGQALLTSGWEIPHESGGVYSADRQAILSIPVSSDICGIELQMSAKPPAGTQDINITVRTDEGHEFRWQVTKDQSDQINKIRLPVRCDGIGMRELLVTMDLPVNANLNAGGNQESSHLWQDSIHVWLRNLRLIGRPPSE